MVLPLHLVLIIESLELEGSIKGHLVQLPCNEKIHLQLELSWGLTSAINVCEDQKQHGTLKKHWDIHWTVYTLWEMLGNKPLQFLNAPSRWICRIATAEHTFSRKERKWIVFIRHGNLQHTFLENTCLWPRSPL